jgi:hypothetical protein
MFLMFTDESILGFLDNIFYSYRALVWEETINICVTATSEKVISLQQLTALNRVVVLCGLGSASQPLPQPPVPSYNPL